MKLIVERQDKTVYNAYQAWENYAYKYGVRDSFFELKYNFRLEDEEIMWIINKLFSLKRIDDYERDYQIQYLGLEEVATKHLKS